MRWTFIAAISCLLISVSPLAAQSSPAPAPQDPSGAAAHFDAATVAMSKPGSHIQGGFLRDGQAAYLNANLLEMIAQAYGLPETQIVGGPTWLGTRLYDVRAKTSSGVTQKQLQAMLRSLLADYFGLSAHTDLRPLPVYALEVSGKLRLASAAAGAPGSCLAAPDAPGASPSARSDLEYQCSNMTMSAFADQLRSLAPTYIDKPVVDRTSLSGRYDFSTGWIRHGQLRSPSDTGYDPSVDVTMFSALEKLGLKLEPTVAPVPVLIVDAVNATPNAVKNPLPALSTPTAFEVAAIKPAPAGMRNMIRVTPGGQVNICCFGLQFFIRNGFDLDPRRIVDPPKWLTADHWDVRATTVPGATLVDVLLMSKSLLQTRFGFAYHEGTQVTPVFDLRADAHPALTPNTTGGVSNCTEFQSLPNITFTCTNMTMAQFAAKLWDIAPVYINKTVVDRTGLKGSYDFAFSWAIATSTGYNGNGPRAGSAAGREAPAPSGGSTIFESLSKLGLKLTSDKAPVKVIVIDHLNREPTPN